MSRARDNADLGAQAGSGLDASDITSGALPVGVTGGSGLNALSASNLSAGTIADARMPNLTGDVTTVEGAVATTISGLAMSKTALVGGAGLTLTTNTLSVDADQSGQITSIGIIGTGEWRGTAVAQAYIADQAINEAKLQVSNAPTNGYVLTARSAATGDMTWEDLGTSFDTAGTGVAMAIAFG